MISYLGVTIDELLQVFEESFAFSDNRPDRDLSLPIEVEEFEGTEAELEAAEAAEAELEDDEDELEDDELGDVFVDDSGQLHASGETVAFAAEVAIEFLTDYILTDDVDDEWLTLDQARGALLAMRILLPEFDELPDVECAYSFTILRDPETGFPKHVDMKVLSGEAEVQASLKFDATKYEGVVTDSTSLAELFASSHVPEDDRSLLMDVISEGILTLAEEQCGIVFDVKAFADSVKLLAAELKVVEEEDSEAKIQH